MMKTSIFGNTIALWGMVFLLLASCSDDNAPDTKPGGNIENVEMPSSDASAPIISGQMVVIRGTGFNENSKIWLQGPAKTKASGVQADIISYSDESISFIAPQMSGNCSVILEQDGQTQELGQIYLEERDLTNLSEYIYAVGYAKDPDSEDAVSPGESSSTTRSGETNSPILYLYDTQNGTFEKTCELPQGEIIKFALPENNGNGNTYYFKYLPETEQVGLYGYDIKEQTEKLVCMDWLYEYNGMGDDDSEMPSSSTDMGSSNVGSTTQTRSGGTSPGMAIGIIENTLCGVEASIDRGFEIVSFGDDGKTTLLKKAFPYDKIDGRYVTQFYCEDDNLIFTYDKESRCVLLPGNIRFEGDDDSYSCVLSLNMRTGDVRVLRDEQDTYFFEVLATKQGVVLVATDKESDSGSVVVGGSDSENMPKTRSAGKTILKLINPETLETVSVLDEVNQYIVYSIYNEKNNSIYWSSSNGTSEDYVFEYNLDSKQVNISDNSLPYIETLFSIKY